MFRSNLLVLASLLVCPALWAQLPTVEVQGLLKGAAILKVAGQSKLIRVGQSLQGVTLLEATSQEATVEIDGVRHVLTMSQRIASSYSVPEIQEVLIQRDEKMQYRAKATINGRSISVLVDTGANIVAMNKSQARALGLDPTSGEPSHVETASGMIEARIVMLDSVDVGGIRVENVRATVLDGAYPTTILLGMTYLRHVNMNESGGILSLSRAF